MVHVDFKTVLVVRSNIMADKQILGGFAEDRKWAAKELQRS